MLLILNNWLLKIKISEWIKNIQVEAAGKPT